MKTIAAILVGALLATPASLFAETLDEVLQKNTVALGGLAALESVRDVTKEGTIKITMKNPVSGVLEGRSRAVFKSPDKALMTTTIGNRTQTKATNGKTYWELDTANPQGAQVIGGARAEVRLEDARIDNVYMALARYEALGVKLELLGNEKVGDREAFVVKKTREYGQQTKAFIDRESGLLLKEETSISQMIPSDWRKVNGILVPHVLTLIYPDSTVVITYETVQINTNVPDSIFEFPASPVKP